MLVFYFVLFLFSVSLNESKLSYQYPNITYFPKCVSDILKKYFHKNKELSVVDMNKTGNEEIVKIVNGVKLNSIVLRESNTRFRTLNDGYVITTGSCKDFINNFSDVTREKYWRPNARFLIIINNLPKVSLEHIFDILLKHNVINVLVMNGSADPELYTYNPFENYACGQHYDRIIEYGKCSTSQEDLYPQKLVTGLRNCTLKVASHHWPPFSIDPMKNNGGMFTYGVEEKVVKDIGKLEHFEVEFHYRDDAEEFSVIKNDMVAVGPLDMLQKREMQMMLGCMFLTPERTTVFDYIWQHLAYTDEFSYLVKKATPIASWKYTYLEFDAIVWTALASAFIVFLLIFLILVRPKDKGQIVLKMVGYLFLAGNRVKGNYFTRYLFIYWVFFAYVINLYYVSNLMSFTTNPIMNYQPSDENDLVMYKMRPCVSTDMKQYLKSVGVSEFIWKSNHTSKGCDNLLESIDTVSKSEELYTVVERSAFRYNQHNYVDERGERTIYMFNEPLTKAVYAIYLYKGFPMLERLQLQMLRMRENGLIEWYLNFQYWERHIKYQANIMEEHYNVIVPWYVLLCGYILSLAVFVIEIIAKMYLCKKCPYLINNK